IRRSFTQVEFHLWIRHAHLRPCSRNSHVLLAWHDGDRRKHLFEKLSLVGLNLGGDLLERRHRLSLNQEHSLPGWQEDSGSYLEARIDVHCHFDSLRLLPRTGPPREGLLVLFLLRLGFGRGLPIDQGCRNLLPITALGAKVANSLAVFLIAADQ